MNDKPGKRFLLFLLFLSSLDGIGLAFAAGGRIVGVVRDSLAATPLANVQVFLEGQNVGDVSDEKGYFEIDGLQPGTYLVMFRLQGYATKQKIATISKQNERIEFIVRLHHKIIELQNLLVTATREGTPDFDLPYLVSSITPRKIARRNAQQTPELLREEIGVFVQKTNQGGGSPIMQGLRANKLLIMVDGIRLNNTTYRGGNTQYLNTVDADNLYRVEVVHGPQSVLYGSDALGGVINLLTRTPRFGNTDKISYHGGLKLGLSSADRTKTTFAHLTSMHSRWSLQIHAAAKSFGDVTRGTHGGQTLMSRLANDTRAQRILPKKQAPNGYDVYDFSLKAHAKLNPAQRITVAYQLNRQHDVPRYDVIEVRKDSLRLFDPQERDLAYLRYENRAANKFYDRLSVTASWQRQFERRLRQKFRSTTQSIDQFRTITTGLLMQFNKIPFGNQHLVYGTELYFDAVATHSSLRDTRTNRSTESLPLFPDGSTFLTFGAYVQDQLAVLRNWQLTAGLRFTASRLTAPFTSRGSDAFDLGTIRQKNTSLTASSALLVPVHENIHLVASLSQGFRTPNLDDVGKVGPGKGSSFFDIPNPAAKPEKSLNLSGGVKIQTRTARAEIIGFYNRLRDLLVRKPARLNGQPFIVDGNDTLQVFHKANAGHAYTAGFAARVDLTFLSRIDVFGHVSYTYGQNLSDGEPLSGIPPVNGLLGIRIAHERTWFELSSRFAAEQSRLSTEDKADLRIPEGGTPAWWTMNLRAGFKPKSYLNASFSVLNIFDRNYREHLSGFNAPGRNLVFSLEFTF